MIKALPSADHLLGVSILIEEPIVKDLGLGTVA